MPHDTDTPAPVNTIMCCELRNNRITSVIRVYCGKRSRRGGTDSIETMRHKSVSLRLTGKLGRTPVAVAVAAAAACDELNSMRDRHSLGLMPDAIWL